MNDASASPSPASTLAAARVAVRDALAAAVRALGTGAGSADAAAQARDHWASAHAAVTDVGLRSLAKFSGELGALIAAPDSEIKGDRAAAFARASDALIDYMATLIAGRRDQPQRLFPAYEALQQARGVAQSNRSDLFFPELSRLPDAPAQVTPMSAEELRGTRRQLEGALLVWMRKPDQAGLRPISDAISRVEAAQPDARLRQLWWVARAVLDAVLHDGLPVDAQVRRLLMQLNLHLGRLVQGPAEAPEALLREALFLAACAQPVTPLVAEVQQRCDLLAAIDTTEATVASPAPAATTAEVVPAPVGFAADAVAAARGPLQGLQDLWGACAVGSAGFADFEARARALAVACAPLGDAALMALVTQLADTASGISRLPDTAREVPVLEGACALLIIEHTLGADHAPDSGFAARADNIVARLKASLSAPGELRRLPAAQWLDDVERETQATAQDALVRAEIERELRDAVQGLEAWQRDTGNQPLLAKLERPLQRVAGAYAILGHADAAAMATQCREQISHSVQGATAPDPAPQLLARRLRALSDFVAASKHGPAQLEAVIDTPAPAAPIALEPLPALELPTLTEPLAAPETPPVQAAPPSAPVPPAAVMPPAPAAPVDGDDGTDPEMIEIFLDEAAEVLQTLSDTVPQSRAQPQDQELLTTLRRGFHTLKGSGRMVGLKHLGEAAWELEQVFNERSAQQQPGIPDLYRLVEVAQGKFSQWIDELRNSKRAAIDAAQLTDWARRLRAGESLPESSPAASAPPPAVELPATELPAIELAPIEPLAIEEPAPPMPAVSPMLPAIEMPALVPEPPPTTVMLGDVAVSRSLYDIMLPEAQQMLALMVEQNRQAQDGGAVTPDFIRATHTLSGIAGTAGLTAIRGLGASLERVLEAATAAGGTLPPPAREPTLRAIDAMRQQVEAIAAQHAPAAHDDIRAALDALNIQPEAPPQPELPAALEPDLAAIPTPLSLQAMAQPAPAEIAVPDTAPAPLVEPAVPEPAPSAAASTAPTGGEFKEGERRRYRLSDDIDPQLLPIFLEEAAELVPQVGQDLRAWRARPDDKLVAQSLKRLLHTLKGSARMAGAMALGQLTHGMESRIENAQRLPALPPQLIDELEASFDRIGTLIGALQQGESGAKAADPAALTQAMVQMSRTQQLATASGAMTQLMPVQYAGEAEAVGQAQGLPRPMIRVRADLIDRLANQAGEVSIARARVSAELSTARGSLRDLTENVGRLRAQLRELEIAAEMQMQSRFSPTLDQSAGHFDPLEFDRFTRLQELTRLMAESVNDVATVQHSLARDLDEAERALTSQAQTTREVQQDLMAIRMVPFASISDRLYRVTRLSAKDAEKRVQLDIVGEQVEVDRGVMDRIAAPIEHLLRNAIAHGIEAPQRRVELGKPEAGALKLEVRQEGNEVVLTLTDDGDGLNLGRIREKAVALGMMREDEALTDQQIANFIFRSGFSTASAVTAEAGRGVGMDVVMAEVTALGGRVTTATERGKGTQFTIHLPLTLSVLQAVVMRAAGNAYAVPTMMVEQVQRLKADVLAAAHAGRRIEWQGSVYPFHHLAQVLELDAGNEAAPFGAVILLRSGSSRAAVQVDDILGGQEIVIKNIGPQLARVPGVTGAAVLGSGETVLILNPLLLTERHLEATAAADAARALQPLDLAEPPAVEPEPERQRSVLVVDDSLTVRKITDRLLTREGYRVLVAKDGVEALEKLRDQLPDVVITDVEMPRMDGFDLVRNVRSDDHLKSLPVIMITSRTAEKHRQHATDIGVDVFLGKPYEEGELLRHIAALAQR